MALSFVKDLSVLKFFRCAWLGSECDYDSSPKFGKDIGGCTIYCNLELNRHKNMKN